MFSFLNLMIFSVCSRRLPFILSFRIPPKFFILPMWVPTGYLLFPPYTSAVDSHRSLCFHYGFPSRGTLYFAPSSPVRSRRVVPIFPVFPLWVPHAFTWPFHRGFVHLTCCPISRAICSLSPVHPQMHRCRRVSITWLPRSYAAGAPQWSPWVACECPYLRSLWAPCEFHVNIVLAPMTI